ncbi:hypothetical protein ACP70R_027829 [Stipagrostis hirtigluma subsp. patula]
MAQPPGTFPVNETTEAIAFLREIDARLAPNPAARNEFYALVTNFGKGVVTDARAVAARAEELLQGHPDLIARFQQFVDPERRARQLLEQVKRTNMEVYNHLLATLFRVDEEKGLDAHAVYQLLGQVFGSEHDGLLRSFAEFLPSKYDPPPPCAVAEREQQRPARKRKPVNYGGADAAESSRARRPKKPRVDDGTTPNVNPAPYDGAGGSSRPSRDRKPRADDSPTPKRNTGYYAGAGASGSSRPRRDKKPRAVDGEKRRGPLGAAANGATARDDGDDEVRRFRAAWEFETGYSKLVATMARAEKLQRSRARGGEGGHGRRGGRASLEELFPSRECREYLAEMYHDQWQRMRRMLQDGDYVDAALEIVVRSLREKEAAAVEESRKRQDPARTAPRLEELVQGRVREQREKRGAGSHGASASAVNRTRRRPGNSQKSSST